MRRPQAIPRPWGSGTRTGLLAVLLAGLVLGVGGCGSSGGSSRPIVVVSAAASLKKAFTTYAGQFASARLRFSFAGSDVLASQIEQGARPDVFASANMKLPQMLHAKGLVEKPVVFAANKLVLAVPKGATKVASLADVQKPGTTLSVGTAAVPVGAYAEKVLERLTPSQRAAVTANVKDREPDVTGIVGKLTEGAVDAGFLYITDVAAAKGQLKAIPLPAELQPQVAYGVAIVKHSAHPQQAQAFVTGLLEGQGRADLLAASFLPPPPA